MKPLLYVKWSMLFMLFFCFGCDKVSPEARVLIDSATLLSKERAVSFMLIKDKLQATKPEDSAAFADYLAKHTTSLDSIATGMRDVSKSLEGSSSLEDRTINQLKELSTTMQACHENFSALDMKFVAKNPDEAAIVKAWAEAHKAGLQKMVEVLTKLREALEKEKAKKQAYSPERQGQFREQLAVM